MNDYFGFQGKTVVVTGASSGGFGWEQTFGRSKEIIDCGSYEATVEWFEKQPNKKKSAFHVA